MTVWSGAQVAAIWEAAGGPAGRAVEWVAIAIGESSLDDQAVSPAGAVGLWQIMPFNAPPYGYTTADLYDPNINAKIAVQMSGGGTNCAAWDSCYANIYVSGRYSFLGWPEPGSADYNNLATAAAEIGTHVTVHISQPPPPGTTDTISGVMADLTQIGGQLYPPLTDAAARLIAVTEASYRKGWRPWGGLTL